MKKAMLLALAALCVSAAQAVTWSTSTTGSASISSSASSVSAMVVFNVTSLSDIAGQQLLTISTTDDSVLGMAVSTDASGNATLLLSFSGRTDYGWSKTSSGNGSIAALASLFHTGENVIAISVSRESTNNTYISWTINGTTISASTAGSQFTSWGANSDTYYQAELTTVSTTVADSVIYTAYTDDITTVPEPTVLALLALGVAGIALKRRAA